ncbi:hypothetical protein [Lichenicoccus sp.]
MNPAFLTPAFLTPAFLTPAFLTPAFLTNATALVAEDKLGERPGSALCA